MQDQDRILSFLQVMGPTIPSKVAKSIKSEILIASAFLSDLSAQGKVKISNLKVGGSPLYYLPGQEDQLLNFVKENLNPKDVIVINQLREKGILREAELELFSKVSLRSLKDFAIPMQVTVGLQKELFWKWHLLSNEQFNQRIGEMINGVSPKPLDQPAKDEQPRSETRGFTISVENPLANDVAWKEEDFDKIVNLPKTEIGPKVMIMKREVPERKLEPIPLAKEKQTSLHGLENKLLIQKVRETAKEPVKVIKEPVKELVKEVIKEPVKEIVKERKEPKKRISAPDNFLSELEEFFARLKIDLEQKEMVRKNVEFNFIVKVPSVVGKVTYYCKAKKKAKCDEKDLSTAYMESQVKKLPLLFLYPKDLHPKALELLNSGAFENLVVKKMD